MYVGKVIWVASTWINKCSIKSRRFNVLSIHSCLLARPSIMKPTCIISGLRRAFGAQPENYLVPFPQRKKLVKWHPGVVHLVLWWFFRHSIKLEMECILRTRNKCPDFISSVDYADGGGWSLSFLSAWWTMGAHIVDSPMHIYHGTTAANLVVRLDAFITSTLEWCA